MARAVQLASDLSQVGLAHHRPPHLWKLRWLGAMAPGGLRTGTSHVSSPVPPSGTSSQRTEQTHIEHIQKITEKKAPETEVWKNIHIISPFIYRGFPSVFNTSGQTKPDPTFCLARLCSQ